MGWSIDTSSDPWQVSKGMECLEFSRWQSTGRSSTVQCKGREALESLQRDGALPDIGRSLGDGALPDIGRSLGDGALPDIGRSLGDEKLTGIQDVQCTYK